MPSQTTIVEGLRSIAERAMVLAVFWHVVVAAAGVALVLGWRPSARRAGVLLALPVASVGALALRSGNPFNGVAFAALAVTLLGVAARLPREPVRRGGAVATGLAVAMIAFAWVYPHFLQARSPAIYLVAAPVGLIPCPTLSLVIGFSLLAGGFGSRAWSLVLGAAGLFYGVFGVMRLGVRLDLPLVAGALGLLAASFLQHQARATDPMLRRA